MVCPVGYMYFTMRFDGDEVASIGAGLIDKISLTYRPAEQVASG
jgi:hypothetical protein